MHVLAACVADYAQAVIDAVTDKLHGLNLPKESVRAAGIDVPMFWNKSGKDREIDKLIRSKLPVPDKSKEQVANKSSVMSVNSLQGSDLAQGVLLGYHLHHDFTLSITESHPGALDHLEKSMRSRIIGLPSNEHSRDATFAAYAAWHIGATNWQDLFPKEPAPILPLGTPVSYWMPIK